LVSRSVSLFLPRATDAVTTVGATSSEMQMSLFLNERG
jgi:hypothetical protein